MNKIITVLTSILLGCLLINPVKAQEKYREKKTENQIIKVEKENILAEKIIEQRSSIDFISYDCTVVMITNERTELPCNYLAITVGGNFINYHYGLRNDQEKLYSISFVLPLELPDNVFLIMMDLKGEDPLTVETQGQCQQQKINNGTDKLTCQAIDSDGNKINGEVLVPSFNIKEIIRDLQ